MLSSVKFPYMSFARNQAQFSQAFKYLLCCWGKSHQWNIHLLYSTKKQKNRMISSFKTTFVLTDDFSCEKVNMKHNSQPISLQQCGIFMCDGIFNEEKVGRDLDYDSCVLQMRTCERNAVWNTADTHIWGDFLLVLLAFRNSSNVLQ